jgi:hypothetical protein
VRGNIVFVGKDLTKIRPAAAVGARAIVVVSGKDIPQAPDVEDIAGDVRVPVVAVSEAGKDQLTMGALATLMFSNSIGSFAPDERELVRSKNSSLRMEKSWRKQRELLRSGESQVLASFISSQVEETARDSDSDGSPSPPDKGRRLPMSQKKHDGESLSASQCMPDLQNEGTQVGANESMLVAERSILDQADQQVMSAIREIVDGPKQQRAQVLQQNEDCEAAPAQGHLLKAVPNWQSLMDFEIKESFEVLDSPRKDATLAAMFGVFEVEGVHVEGTTPKTVGGVESSNVKNDATPSVEPQAVTDERGPVVTADMVCVTPGLSVTNVYNEVQAQSMHRGRTPAAQQVYANRLLDDNSNTGTENMDPQIEDFTSRSAIPAHMTLHSEADLTQHADVNQTDNSTK